MLNDNQRAETIRRYMKDKYGYDPDLSEILNETRAEQMWQLAVARAYFREQNHFERLEDAPPGIDWITVADGNTVLNYEWRLKMEQYGYVMMNNISRNDYDKFYEK